MFASIVLPAFGDDVPTVVSFGGEEWGAFLRERSVKKVPLSSSQEIPSFYTTRTPSLIPTAERLQKIMELHQPEGCPVEGVSERLRNLIERKALTLHDLWKCSLDFTQAIAESEPADSSDAERVRDVYRKLNSDRIAALFTETPWGYALVPSQLRQGDDALSCVSPAPLFLPFLGRDSVDPLEALIASLHNVIFVRIPTAPLKRGGRMIPPRVVMASDFQRADGDPFFLSLRAYLAQCATQRENPPEFAKHLAPLALKNYRNLKMALGEIVTSIGTMKSCDSYRYHKLLWGFERILSEPSGFPVTLWGKSLEASLQGMCSSVQLGAALQNVKKEDEFLQTDPQTGASPRTDTEIIQWARALLIPDYSWLGEDAVEPTVKRCAEFIKVTFAGADEKRTHLLADTLFAVREEVERLSKKFDRAGYFIPISQPTREGILHGCEELIRATQNNVKCALEYARDFINQTSPDQPESLKDRFNRSMADIQRQEDELGQRFPLQHASSSTSPASAE